MVFFNSVAMALQDNDIQKNNDPVVIVNQIQNELIKLTDPNQQYKGITYNISSNNHFPHHWLHMTPLIPWGASSSTLAYVKPCNAADQNCDPLFLLPKCKTNKDCTNSICANLNAFYDGKKGLHKKLCIGSTEKFLDVFYNAIINAENYVDVTTLSPFPDIRFFATLQNALSRLAYKTVSGSSVITVRILRGYPPSLPRQAPITMKKSKPNVITPMMLQPQTAYQKLQENMAIRNEDKIYLKKLVNKIQTIKGIKLQIYIGTMRSCTAGWYCSYGLPLIDKVSWNHSKIVAVDGKYIVTGGHNLWTGSYLINDPIHDVGINFQGNAVLDAHKFINKLWEFTCTYNQSYIYTADIQAFLPPNNFISDCPIQPLLQTQLETSTPNEFKYKNVVVMSLGKLGSGIITDTSTQRFHRFRYNQSDVARNLFLKRANRIIRIAQQNIGIQISSYNIYWPSDNPAGNTLQILVDALLQNIGSNNKKGIEVYIVVTNLTAKDAEGTAYSTGVSIIELADQLYTLAKLTLTKQKRKITDKTLIARLCKNLNLATIRFSTDNTWPDGTKIGNHSKIWIIDNLLFYIGSHNVYESNLQEFGYVIANKDITIELIEKYYDKLWKFSKKTAISGHDVNLNNCYFYNKYQSK